MTRRRFSKFLGILGILMLVVGSTLGLATHASAAGPPGVTISTTKVHDVVCATCNEADSIVLLDDGLVGLASAEQFDLNTLSYHLNSVTLTPGQAMVGYVYDKATQSYASLSARTDTEYVTVDGVVTAVISGYNDPALTGDHPFLQEHKPMLVADVTTVEMSCAAGNTVGALSSTVMTTYPFDALPPTSFISEFRLTCMGS